MEVTDIFTITLFAFVFLLHGLRSSFYAGADKVATAVGSLPVSVPTNLKTGFVVAAVCELAVTSYLSTVSVFEGATNFVSKAFDTDADCETEQ